MARLSEVLNKYNLHTFAPDNIELTEEEYQKASECCGYIRGLLQKGWHKITKPNEQITIEEALDEWEKIHRGG